MGFTSGARQLSALMMQDVTTLHAEGFMELYADRQIGLLTLLLVMLGLLVAAGSVIHAMGHPLICKCGYVTLFYGGLDDAEVSQHFIDWYTFSHVGHGIAVYVFMRAFTDHQPPTTLPTIALGLLISVSVAGLWEVIENAPFVVTSFAKTTRVHGYVGDSVVNSMGDMLATVLGFLVAARAPTWLSIAIIAAILFVLPRDNTWIFSDQWFVH